MPTPFKRRRNRLLEKRLVWILGAPRTGSTWLLNLLKVDPRVIALDEPGIGVHLAPLVSGLFGLRPETGVGSRLRLNDYRHDSTDYFFNDRFRSAWMPALRELILARLSAQIGEAARSRGSLVVIKEPHGSIGADLLMAALPASRMIFLLRDGRDVIDSARDSAGRGAWGSAGLTGFETSDSDPFGYLRDRAVTWLRRTEIVQAAYERQDPDRRRLVRYEELRERAAPSVSELLQWLDLELPANVVAAHVEKLSFERIAPEHRGEGRFARAGRPGFWREHLAEDERAEIERIIGPKLRELGYPP